MIDKTIQELQRIVRENPSDSFTWLKLGDYYVKKGDTKQGATAYYKAAKHIQDKSKAIKILQVVLNLDPDNQEAKRLHNLIKQP